MPPTGTGTLRTFCTERWRHGAADFGRAGNAICDDRMTRSMPRIVALVGCQSGNSLVALHHASDQDASLRKCGRSEGRIEAKQFIRMRWALERSVPFAASTRPARDRRTGHHGRNDKIGAPAVGSDRHQHGGMIHRFTARRIGGGHVQRQWSAACLRRAIRSGFGGLR